MYTIFLKELRQHYPLLTAMIAFCLLLQNAPPLLLINQTGVVDGEWFFFIALFLTMLFTGAAAAVSFSIETEEKTFAFLRRLPVSAQNIAWGKGMFLFCSTGTVLAATLFFAFLSLCFWRYFSVMSEGRSVPAMSQAVLWASVGFGIIDVFVWGLFWSPRCRNQITAVLLTYLCAGFAAWFFANFINGTGETFLHYDDASNDYSGIGFVSNNVLLTYAYAVPFRIAVDVIVTLFAVKGMKNWHRFGVLKSRRRKPAVHESLRLSSSVNERLSAVSVSPPLNALIRHSVRQSAPIYLSGIIAVVYFLFFFFRSRFLSNYQMGNSFFAMLPPIAGVLLLVFLGSIFSQDHRNASYRFFSRCGVSTGKVWISRMLPAFLIYLPMLVLPFVNAFVSARPSNHDLPHYSSEYYIASGVVAWLIPFAVGAFVSVSCRSVILSVILTAAISWILYFSTIVLVFELLSIYPLWTGLPIGVTLLIASRWRCTYWLREQIGWKSWLVPLSPVGATLLLVGSAIPLYRVYSIPYVSWERFSAAVQTMDIHEKLSPEQLNALLLEARQEGKTPVLSRNFWSDAPAMFIHSQKDTFYVRRIGVDKAEDVSVLKDELRKQISVQQKRADDFPGLQEYVLRQMKVHENPLQEWYRIGLIASSGVDRDIPIEQGIQFVSYFCPWEKYRHRRAARLMCLYYLNDAGILKDPELIRLAEKSKKQIQHFENTAADPWAASSGIISVYAAGILNPFIDTDRPICDTRLYSLYEALYLYYLEHGETLPENLDVLVEERYLEKLPINPVDGKAAELKKGRYGTDPDAFPFLQLGRTTMTLSFMETP